MRYKLSTWMGELLENGELSWDVPRCRWRAGGEFGELPEEIAAKTSIVGADTVLSFFLAGEPLVGTVHLRFDLGVVAKAGKKGSSNVAGSPPWAKSFFQGEPEDPASYRYLDAAASKRVWKALENGGTLGVRPRVKVLPRFGVCRPDRYSRPIQAPPTRAIRRSLPPPRSAAPPDPLPAA